MAADQSQLEAALSAVEEPELGLTLGELGLLRSVRPRRRRVLIEVALPVAAWPGTDELAEEIHRAAGSRGRRRGGRARVRGDDRRGAGRAPRSACGPACSATASRRRGRRRRHGHDHAGHGHAHGRRAPMPAFLGPDAKTRVIGVSSGKGGVGKSTVTVNLAIALAAGRAPGRPARRRRLRLLGPQDARDRPRPDHHRRHRHPDIGPRRQVPLHGLLRAGRPAGHLARPDAAQGDPAVPDRRLLGRARLRARRHAAGHRRRRARPWPR